MFHSHFTYHTVDLVISDREIWPKRNTSEVPSSNIGQNTEYLDRNFSVFLDLSRQVLKLLVVALLGDCRFLYS